MLNLTLTPTFDSKFNDLNRFALGAIEAEQVTIPYCGHAPQEETPDEVNPQLIQFLHKHSEWTKNGGYLKTA